MSQCDWLVADAENNEENNLVDDENDNDDVLDRQTSATSWIRQIPDNKTLNIFNIFKIQLSSRVLIVNNKNS